MRKNPAKRNKDLKVKGGYSPPFLCSKKTLDKLFTMRLNVIEDRSLETNADRMINDTLKSRLIIAKAPNNCQVR